MWFKNEDTKTIDSFRVYSETSCNAFNACRYSIAKMSSETDANSSSKFMIDFLGQGEDLNIWMHLHEERKLLLIEVMNFANETTKKMQIVRDRMNNKKDYATFKDCYDGFSTEDAGNTAKSIQTKSLKLRYQVISFYEKVQSDRRTTIEQEKFMRVLAGVLLVTGACCGVAFIAVNPEAVAIDSLALRIGLSSMIDRVLETSIAMIERGIAALPIMNGPTQSFSQSETRRAIIFLKSIDSKPINDTIYQAMESVYDNSTELSSSTRSQCNRLIDSIIEESQKLGNACKVGEENLPLSKDLETNDVKESIGFLFNIAQGFKRKEVS